MIPCIYCDHINENAEQYLTHMEQFHPAIDFRKKTLFYQFLNASKISSSGVISECKMGSDQQETSMVDSSIGKENQKTDRNGVRLHETQMRNALATKQMNKNFGKPFVLANDYTLWSTRNKIAIQEYYENFKKDVTAHVNKVNVFKFFDTEEFRPIVVALCSSEVIGFQLAISSEALNCLYKATIKLFCEAYPNLDVTPTAIEEDLKILKNSGIQVCSSWKKKLGQVIRNRRCKKKKSEE